MDGWMDTRPPRRCFCVCVCCAAQVRRASRHTHLYNGLDTANESILPSIKHMCATFLSAEDMCALPHAFIACNTAHRQTTPSKPGPMCGRSGAAGLGP
mmetsp:Transcript_43117/g.107727  ORF Transcript_43117/g.107727 Transcript_43117/m.107727 type:complete len:98 (+) Transcript_43117:88-381(+)